MSERRPWTPQEDNVLQKLYEIDGVKKWSEISRLMETDYHIIGRNGKQCRERYHNHLKGGIKRDRWSPEEQERLVELHAQHGNRWSYISKLIQGRPQNCVKNMLYSKMRKSVRQLNRFSYIYYRRSLKQIKLTFVNRLIDITQSAYKKVENDRTPAELTAIDIKNDILRLNISDNQQISEEDKLKTKELIEDIHNFKKDNQRYQRGVTLTKIKKQKLKKKDEWDVPSNEQIAQVEEEESQKHKKPLRIKRRKRETVPKTNNQKKEKQIQTLDSKKGSKVTNIPTQSMCSTPKVCNIDRKESLRSRVGVMRADSITSNFLNLCQEEGLDQPIQIGDLTFNMTPTPYARNSAESWNNLPGFWRTSEF